MYKGEVASYTENQETGMAVAQVDIKDGDEIKGSMTVHDKIPNMKSRIQEDLEKAIIQIRGQVEVEPPQKTFTVK